MGKRGDPTANTGQGDVQYIHIKSLAQCGYTDHYHLDAARLFNLQCKKVCLIPFLIPF
jgi:hypothetical protein